MSRAVTVAIHRRHQPGAPWSVGVGFDTHLAWLTDAGPSLAEADAVLTKERIVRTGPWHPHPTRGGHGWLVAPAIDELDARPDASERVTAGVV